MFGHAKEQSIPWKKYLSYGKRIFLKKNSVIFKQDNSGNGFYYIHSGLVRITSIRSDQTERILDIARPGRTIGEFSLLDQMPSPTTAITQEDSIFYHFELLDYETLIQREPDFILLLANSLFQKEKLHLGNLIATNSNAYYKIAYSLISLMDSCKSTEIKMTQQDLSRYVGLTRMTIHKVLKEWASEKILSVDQRKIWILDPYTLRAKLSSK